MFPETLRQCALQHRIFAPVSRDRSAYRCVSTPSPKARSGGPWKSCVAARKIDGQQPARSDCPRAYTHRPPTPRFPVSIRYRTFTSEKVRPAERNRVGDGLTPAAIPQHRNIRNRYPALIRHQSGIAATASCVSFVVSPQGVNVGFAAITLSASWYVYDSGYSRRG
jgi:hypothetical protein